MTTKKEVDLETKPERKINIKEAELTVVEVEKSSVIVNVNGWRMRVYFAENTVIIKPNLGQKIKVQYTGNIEDVHSVVFKKL